MRGGAERQLVVLACGLADRGHRVSIFAFYGGEPFRKKLAKAGVRVVDLQKKGRWDLFSFAPKLIGAVRDVQPDILHSYLAVPNVIAVLISPFIGRAKIVWGIRASDLDLSAYSRLSRNSYRAERFLSRYPAVIICNSKAGRAHAIQRGYPASKLIVIPNGIDTEVFKFDPAGRARLRKHWRVSDDTFLVGLVARVDPAKDHRTFLRAAELILARRVDIRFVCVGDGVDQLARTVEATKLGDRLLLENERNDLAAVYSAIDIVCLTSTSEGFSNVIAEAMSCSRTCVATDVGELRLIIDQTGSLVKARDPVRFADIVLRTLESNLVELEQQSRDRVTRLFSVDALVSASERVFINIVNGNPHTM